MKDFDWIKEVETNPFKFNGYRRLLFFVDADKVKEVKSKLKRMGYIEGDRWKGALNSEKGVTFVINDYGMVRYNVCSIRHGKYLNENYSSMKLIDNPFEKNG